MNGFDHSQRQETLSLKRRSWQLDQEIMRRSSQQIVNGAINTALVGPQTNPSNGRPNLDPRSGFVSGLLDHRHDDLVSSVVPAVTVVLEGRSICQRINLHKHESYQSLAMALRRMFGSEDDENGGDGLDLSNAVPGHLIAYEDIENDLLLAGDLNWKDFVRVAKRIRIVPAKSNSRKP